MGVVVGGVGIFLVGMILLSEGLRSAAGEALRTILQRFARTPFRAICSGTAVTAVVQSSSATTLTTIGFVSAGLLTFPQAVGVIFGANLGTTSTGWLVSLLGLKLSLSVIAFPMVGVGALARLLGKGRVAHGGMALAGFGLIFVGIDVLQGGMEGLAERIDPSAFPGGTMAGRLVLVLVGGAMTVVLQSSSAAVATTLTGLHTGAVGLEQAALLVVGQNLGTTVKAVLASIGGSVPVRRTALAHILFNGITAVLALLFLPLLLRGAAGVAGPHDPAVAIALFHSAFNVLGVAVLFPVLGPFARLVERWVPETSPSLTRNLDPAVAEVPEVAVEAARRSALEVAGFLLRSALEELGASAGRPTQAGRGLAGGRPEAQERGEEAREALLEIRSFLTRVRSPPGMGPQFGRHLSVLHAADHLDRFRRALREKREVDREMGGMLAEELAEWVRSWEEGTEPAPSPDGLARRSGEFAAARKRQRASLLARAAAGDHDPVAARRQVDGLIRLDRLGYHAWRAAYHLRAAAPDREGASWDESEGGSEEGTPSLEERASTGEG